MTRADKARRYKRRRAHALRLDVRRPKNAEPLGIVRKRDRATRRRREAAAAKAAK